MTYFLRPPEIADVYTLARSLRSADRAEVTALGVLPAVALRASYRSSLWKWTLVVEDKVAALFGMGGNALSDVGNPWLLTGDAIDALSPRLFFGLGRWAVDEMLRRRSRLEGYVAADYRKACRFVEAIGFAVDVPQPVHPYGALFSKFHVER